MNIVLKIILILTTEKAITSQPAQFMQQPMQIIATPSTSQGKVCMDFFFCPILYRLIIK